MGLETLGRAGQGGGSAPGGRWRSNLKHSSGHPLYPEDSDRSGFYFFFKEYALKNYLFLGCVGSGLRQAASLQRARFSLVAACGSQWLRWAGLAALRDVGSQFSDQGLNLRPLLCEVDSSPLGRRGSPWALLLECLVPAGY